MVRSQKTYHFCASIVEWSVNIGVAVSIAVWATGSWGVTWVAYDGFSLGAAVPWGLQSQTIVIRNWVPTSKPKLKHSHRNDNKKTVFYNQCYESVLMIYNKYQNKFSLTYTTPIGKWLLPTAPDCANPYLTTEADHTHLKLPHTLLKLITPTWSYPTPFWSSPHPPEADYTHLAIANHAHLLLTKPASCWCLSEADHVHMYLPMLTCSWSHLPEANHTHLKLTTSTCTWQYPLETDHAHLQLTTPTWSCSHSPSSRLSTCPQEICKPAVMTDDLLEVFLLLLSVWVVEHEVVVTLVVDVLVHGQDVDVLHANTDADARIAKPEEVNHLLVVGDVVWGCLKVMCSEQWLQKHVTRHVHPQHCAQQNHLVTTLWLLTKTDNQDLVKD